MFCRISKRFFSLFREFQYYSQSSIQGYFNRIFFLVIVKWALITENISHYDSFIESFFCRRILIIEWNCPHASLLSTKASAWRGNSHHAPEFIARKRYQEILFWESWFATDSALCAPQFRILFPQRLQYFHP